MMLGRFWNLEPLLLLCGKAAKKVVLVKVSVHEQGLSCYWKKPSASQRRLGKIMQHDSLTPRLHQGHTYIASLKTAMQLPPYCTNKTTVKSQKP